MTTWTTNHATLTVAMPSPFGVACAISIIDARSRPIPPGRHVQLRAAISESTDKAYVAPITRVSCGTAIRQGGDYQVAIRCSERHVKHVRHVGWSRIEASSTPRQRERSTDSMAPVKSAAAIDRIACGAMNDLKCFEHACPRGCASSTQPSKSTMRCLLSAVGNAPVAAALPLDTGCILTTITSLATAGACSVRSATSGSCRSMIRWTSCGRSLKSIRSNSNAFKGWSRICNTHQPYNSIQMGVTFE